MSSQSDFREALAAFQGGSLDRARSLAEGLVAAEPGNAAAQHLLGLIQCRSGTAGDGIEHLRRASDIEPANVPFRVMLVRALVDDGRGAEAFALAPRPEGKEPATSALWQARGEAADAAGDYHAAAEAWLETARRQPQDWRAWSNAGTALAELGQWREVADALDRAAQINPAELPIRRNLACALAMSKQLIEARREVELLLANDPGDSASRMLLAKTLSELGQHQQSLEQYDEAVRQALARPGGERGQYLIELARRPLRSGSANATDSFDLEMLKSLAALLERTNRLDELKAFLAAARAAGHDEGEFTNLAAAMALRNGDPARAKQLLDAKKSTGDPGYFYRLKAKVEEALGNSAAAFSAAEAMNRSVADYQGWRRKAADFRQRLRASLREAEAKAGTITPLPPGPRRRPAFLVGFPRSGTTLLDTFLMGHPDTAVMEEVHMLGAAESSLGNAARLDQRSPAELERARAAYFAELDRHVDPDFTGLVVDKLPLNMLGLPFIYALFPDARMIFAQRHPADCVLSCFMQNFVLNDAMASFLDIADSADLYDAVLAQFSFSRARLPLAVHTLVYEQLVADSESAMRPLIGFLGLDWRDELLDHRSTAAARGAIITPSYDQVVKPLSSAPSGRWRRYEAQLAPVLPTLLGWAQKLGYCEDGGENSQ